jgi:DNA-binding NarL/FixJ family response regulator
MDRPKREAIRVLVADDSPLFREALANFVKRLEGVVVTGIARDGVEALHLTTKTSAQVVFMDLMMPGLDGVAVTRALKQMPAPPAIIICTSYDDDRMRRLVLDAGADAFLHKRDLALEAEQLIRGFADRVRERDGRGES